MTIKFDDAAHGHAIAQEVGVRHWDHVISRESEGRLLGGVLYSDATDNSIQMHAAGFARNWLCRDLLWVAFDYPFTQCDFQVIFARILSSNTRSLAFAKQIGLNTVAELADAYRDGPLIILKLNRVDCRWLGIACPANRIMTAHREAARAA